MAEESREWVLRQEGDSAPAPQGSEQPRLSPPPHAPHMQYPYTPPPTYTPPPPGMPPQPYPPYGAPYPMYAPPRKTNGMALASLIVSIISLITGCFFLLGLTSLLGAIFGHVARSQIRDNGEDGDGMAMGGIWVGWIGFGLGIFLNIIYTVIIVAAISSS